MSKETSSKHSKEPVIAKPVTQVAEKPAVERVPWNPWLAVLVVILTYKLSQIISGIFVSIYPLFKNWTGPEAQSWVENNVGVQFVYILIAEIITIGTIYLFLKYYKVGFAKIGLIKPRWKDFGIGIMAAPVYFAIYLISVAIASHLVPSLNVDQTQQIGYNNVHGGLPLFLTFLSLVILPPLAEEIMVRGFLYSSLKKALPTIAAVLITSALFASAHLGEGGAAGPLYIAAIDTFILSLILIGLRELTGSLWASITLHAIKNGVAFVALFALHAK